MNQVGHGTESYLLIPIISAGMNRGSKCVRLMTVSLFSP